MSKKIIILLLILIIIGICLFIILFFQKKEIQSMKELYYVVNDGRSIYGKVEYHLIYKDGEYLLESKLEGYKDEEKYLSKVSKEEVDEILSILNFYKVSRWNGFDQASKMVMDGKSFTFRVKTLDDEEIIARGYMKYPKNYHEVVEKILSIFEKINQQHFKKLFDFDLYQNFQISQIKEVLVEKINPNGKSEEKVTEENKIMELYDYWSHAMVGMECSAEDEKYKTIYHFIKNDQQQFIIEEGNHSLIIQNKNYYYYFFEQ